LQKKVDKVSFAPETNDAVHRVRRWAVDVAFHIPFNQLHHSPCPRCARAQKHWLERHGVAYSFIAATSVASLSMEYRRANFFEGGGEHAVVIAAMAGHGLLTLKDSQGVFVLVA
jgi:hypothetical protein